MTESELIQAVYDALLTTDDPEGYHTTEEWADMMGLALESTRRRLKHLIRAGRIEVGEVRRASPLRPGVYMPISAFKFLPADER